MPSAGSSFCKTCTSPDARHVQESLPAWALLQLSLVPHTDEIPFFLSSWVLGGFSASFWDTHRSSYPSVGAGIRRAASSRQTCPELQTEPIQLPVLSTGTRRGEKQLRPGGILGSWWGITAETFKTIQNVQSDLKRIHS